MSLIIPDSLKEFCVIFFDPGLNNIGVSIFYIDFYTFNVKRIVAFTFHPERIAIPDPFDEDFHGVRPEKLWKLERYVSSLMLRYRPIACGYETPFFNRRRPSAFEPLVEAVSCIRRAIHSFNPYMNFTEMPPMVIKQFVGAKSMKGKEHVLEAVKENKQITNLLTCPIEMLDEHAIDATAAGYAYCRLENFNV